MAYAFPPELNRLVQEKMATGQYPSQDDLLLDAIHALEEIQQRQEQLRQELGARIANADLGHAAPLNRAAFLAEARRRVADAG